MVHPLSCRSRTTISAKARGGPCEILRLRSQTRFAQDDELLHATYNKLLHVNLLMGRKISDVFYFLAWGSSESTGADILLGFGAEDAVIRPSTVLAAATPIFTLVSSASDPAWSGNRSPS